MSFDETIILAAIWAEQTCVLRLWSVKTGVILGTSSLPTLAREGHDAVMQRMADLILGLIRSAGLKKEDLAGIGIGVPGVLDLEKGETIFLPKSTGHLAGYPTAGDDSQLDRFAHRYPKRCAFHHPR